jgi:hypothetical protein
MLLLKCTREDYDSISKTITGSIQVEFMHEGKQNGRSR